MLGFAIDSKNNFEPRKNPRLDRLSMAIAWNDGTAAGRSVADAPGSEGSVPNTPQASTSCESPVTDVGFQILGGHPPSPLETVERKQDKSFSPNETYIEKAAKQIVDVLMGTVSCAMEELRPQVANDHAKLEATADNVIRISEGIQQVKSVVAALSPQVESLGREEATLRNSLTVIDERLTREETARQWTQDRLTELSTTQEAGARQVQACTETVSKLEAMVLNLGTRLEALDGTMHAQTEVAARLNSLCGNLEQAHQSLVKRLDSQDQAIRVLRTEVRKRGALLDRFLASFRNLDLRREDRFPVDKTVQVVVTGETEAIIPGRIVNASENGLGLMLETPAAVGSEVRIEVGGKLVSGMISHCKSQGDAYSAGLMLTAPLSDE